MNVHAEEEFEETISEFKTANYNLDKYWDSIKANEETNVILDRLREVMFNVAAEAIQCIAVIDKMKNKDL